MSLNPFSSSSAIHNTQAGFSRWGLWEKHDKSVGRGIYGSCDFSAELCACFLFLMRKLEEKFLLKSQAQGFLREDHSDKREKNT